MEIQERYTKKSVRTVRPGEPDVATCLQHWGPSGGEAAGPPLPGGATRREARGGHAGCWHHTGEQ